jgi:hypothetical protein
MYEWKTLRMLAGLLLCIPLVHFVYLVSRDITHYLDPSPEVWDKEIAELIDSDLNAALPVDPIVVIGGQRVRLWKDLPARLQPRATLLRPLGDATIEDLTYHYDRLAGYYRPDVLVIFPGYADLHLRDEKTPQEFSDSLRELLNLDEAYGASAWRYVITPLRMPLHPEDDERIAAMTGEAQKLALELPNLVIIDPNPMLRDNNGAPNPDFYRGDGVNLNREGYAMVTLLLESELRNRNELLASLRASQ